MLFRNDWTERVDTCPVTRDPNSTNVFTPVTQTFLVPCLTDVDPEDRGSGR